MAQITLSTFADSLLAAKLAAKYLLLAADRTILPKDHPALFYGGDVAGGGSNVIKIPIVGLMGYDPLASGTEGAAVTPTAWTDSAVSCTVALKVKAYQSSDFAKMVDALGIINVETFALDGIQAGWNHLITLIAAMAGGFTNEVGSTGVNATVANFIDATTTLNMENAPPGRLTILHPRQWGDIVADMATVSGGTLTYDPAAPGTVRSLARGNGFQGSFLGVDVFTSTQIPPDGGSSNWVGMMFARGAIAWADGTPTIEDPTHQMLVGPKVKFAMGRTELSQTTEYVSSMYLGVVEGIDGFGVDFTTDL